MQTDNTANIGRKAFISKKANASRRFDRKEPVFLLNDRLLTFNGATTTRQNGINSMTQHAHTSRLSNIKTDGLDNTAFIVERSRGAYISAINRPDLTFGFSICSQYPHPDIFAAKQLNKVIGLAEADENTVLRFVPLKWHRLN